MIFWLRATKPLRASTTRSRKSWHLRRIEAACQATGRQFEKIDQYCRGKNTVTGLPAFEDAGGRIHSTR
jgi:hypothetical protein